MCHMCVLNDALIIDVCSYPHTQMHILTHAMPAFVCAQMLMPSALSSVLSTPTAHMNPARVAIIWMADEEMNDVHALVRS